MIVLVIYPHRTILIRFASSFAVAAVESVRAEREKERNKEENKKEKKKYIIIIKGRRCAEKEWGNSSGAASDGYGCGNTVCGAGAGHLLATAPSSVVAGYSSTDS